MPLPALRSDMVRYTASSSTSTVPAPPETRTQWLSAKPTLSGSSPWRLGNSSGRTLASSESSATRAARFADRTEAKVATASTSVPAPVASDEMVTQSATGPA